MQTEIVTTRLSRTLKEELMVVLSSCVIDLSMLAMLGSEFFPTFILVVCLSNQPDAKIIFNDKWIVILCHFKLCNSYVTHFRITVLKYKMPYPLGNRASKRICGKRTIS